MWREPETGVFAATRRVFVKLATSGRDHRLTAFLSAQTAARLAGVVGAAANTVAVPVAASALRVLWQQAFLPRLAAGLGLDVLYCPSYTVPLWSRCPRVVTVHDLIAWKRPDLCRLRNLLHLRALVHASVNAARMVMVPSEVVKRDLIEIFRTPEEKIRVMPWGVDLNIQRCDRDSARELVRGWYGIDSPFILFVGVLEPKKNLPSLLQATRRLGVLLVVVGAPGWGERRVRRVITREGPDVVRSLGFVPEERLSALYSAAEVFAFPSLIEGFGLPVVEAMACGTPVVTSDDPALRDTCGGAALHVPAQDVGALAACLRQVLEDPRRRAELAERGLRRAAEFTWERSVDVLLDSLRLAAEG